MPSLFFFLILLIWLSIREYKPEETESVTIEGKGSRTLSEGDSLRVTSWNIGYGGLDQDHDFFMDGGKDVRPKSEDVIRTNLDGITRQIEELNSDVYFLQETDVDSKRSYHVNEYAHLAEAFPEFENTFAPNYKKYYVPYPLPTIGKVEAAFVSLNSFSASESEDRPPDSLFLACPSRTAETLSSGQSSSRFRNGKGTGAGQSAPEATTAEKAKSPRQNFLSNFWNRNMQKEIMLTSPAETSTRPSPGKIWSSTRSSILICGPQGFLICPACPRDWILAEDHTVPSCRLLNQPYDPESPDTQFYIIDGFLLSPNLTLEEVKTTDAGFRYADHNPVTIQVRLAPPV